ncbi:MAG TPA: hypothetical protein EYP82_04200 [Hydrogenothermaceae bacterium]|nr:hypothetical protein [Hydrogenothermaceae bacterium]
MFVLENTDAKKIMAIEMLRYGVPIKVIAYKLSISERTVKRIKKQANVKCNLRNKATKEEKWIALNFYKNGLSEHYIAKLLGVRASCLFREMWKKEGIL